MFFDLHPGKFLVPILQVSNLDLRVIQQLALPVRRPGMF